MESRTQRLAREISIMELCGGPLSRACWMRHIADELAAVQPLEAADLANLAAAFGGSGERAGSFVRGVELMCAAFATDPSSVFWTSDDGWWSRTLLAINLDVLAVVWTTPGHELPDHVTRDLMQSIERALNSLSPQHGPGPGAASSADLRRATQNEPELDW